MTNVGPEPDDGLRRVSVVGVVLLAVLTLAALAFGGYEHRHWRSLHQRAAERTDAKLAAAQAIPAFTEFDYQHLDDDIANAKRVLTECFGKDYVKTLTQAIPQAQQAKAQVTDVVQGAQVLDLKGSLAHVLVFFDQKAVFGDGRPSKVTPYRVVVDMVKVKGTWKVNYLDIGGAGDTAKRCTS